MTTIPGLIPGTKFSFQVQKPKVVRMHSFLDLEEFQSTTKLYGQTIDWPEWFCSPTRDSECRAVCNLLATHVDGAGHGAAREW